MRTKYRDIKPFVTKDGSTVRELMHPLHHGNKNQSLAEAIIPAGSKTGLHLHRSSEEIYYVISGQGIITLGMKTFHIEPGDTVLIPPLNAHSVENTVSEDLHILCACSPAYSDDDTELLDC
ncbi:MAG TPA: cupin domain-containing protein [Gammaproteobacteria bacterium]|nr:cupin domain-containing protein [Gammaproteobacteria bacterium]